MPTTKYSDLRTNFDVHPNTRDLALALEESAVKASIRNIVYTDKYERFHKPGFGAGLPQKLFENIGRMSEYEINTRTKEAIIRYEPRVTNVQVETKITDDLNDVIVYIIFTTINISTPITFQVILKRVR